MVAEDFLRDPQVREWLDGVEPAWTLLTFESCKHRYDNNVSAHVGGV